MDIKNSTILITGGTSGIGLELAKQLLTQGASTLIITGRDADRLSKIQTELPQIYTIQSDVSKPEDIRNLYTFVTKQFPTLNMIINNAGIMRNLDVRDASLSLETITAEIDINLSGIIRMVHQFLPHLLTKPSAAIVNVSSGLAFIPFPVSPIYSAAKAGVHAYTQVLRLQLKETNVEVIELAPPATDTPLGDPFKGLVDSGMNMITDKLVKLAIKGIMNGTSEIKPGLAKVLKAMSRIAPNITLNMLDSSIQKAKARN
ncbi:SDR family oxidoreductase [Spirosoma radiotolerans]|uniref:Short-chain dehydrogenase n=1 Tax=Spirosoma radiotolerans TaxID=1379870 RepID=A0A0E3ZXV7_9BACT|nr:SDR family NAD(P)-dependent oxidoreductase [Spirosoma radiotolerans]AKD57144.1 short-chain dehydrogenase [Spirosoma radiotolerans]